VIHDSMADASGCTTLVLVSPPSRLMVGFLVCWLMTDVSSVVRKYAIVIVSNLQAMVYAQG